MFSERICKIITKPRIKNKQQRRDCLTRFKKIYFDDLQIKSGLSVDGEKKSMPSTL